MGCIPGIMLTPILTHKAQHTKAQDAGAHQHKRHAVVVHAEHPAEAFLLVLVKDGVDRLRLSFSS